MQLLATDSKQLLYLRTSTKLVRPELDSWVLDQLSEWDQKPPQSISQATPCKLVYILKKHINVKAYLVICS